MNHLIEFNKFIQLITQILTRAINYKPNKSFYQSYFADLFQLSELES